MTSDRLWLPTAVDELGQVVDEGCDRSSKTVAATWFSASIITPEQPTDFTVNFAPALARLNQDFTGCGDSVTKSAMIRIYPTASQRAIFRKWFGVSRYVYNKTVDYLKTVKGRRGDWQDIANMIQADLPEWTDDVPYQIKRIAVKDACSAYTNEKKKAKKSGKKFELSFRSRKNPKQSCYIPKSAVKPEGIYYTISGKGLIYTEDLPEFFGDCRLIYRQGRWFLQVPHETAVTKGENQTRMVALDPGVRTFQTFYSPDLAGVLGEHDFGRLVRLCQHLDDLVSRYSR
jgi:putative transposase